MNQITPNKMQQAIAAGKYRPFNGIALPDRQWPNRDITQAPRWLSTDLRDGNQAIFDPMDSDTKLKFFQMLTRIGFKEIEIGFPAASTTELEFTRRLIEEKHIPDDVTIQVLTQAHPKMIASTMESLRGAKQAIVHVYTSTSPSFIKTVFKMTGDQVTRMAIDAVKLIKKLAAEQPETRFMLEYSPEMFSQTPLPFARDICNAVTEAWGATPDNKVILNLPATVEVCKPNQMADMIEWMDRHLARRDTVVMSLHNHNDRGTAVAATELGLMAGAQRVEGCLFGNGERTGNVDLAEVALNMASRGVDPQLDFSNLREIARAVEFFTGIPISPRHPYGGDLAFTAFSGSHQDAMRKGMAEMKEGEPWDVPYLNIDPRDIGMSLTNLIRINSQSGKGGIAYVVETKHGIEMPRRLQIEFSAVIQKHAEQTGKEVSSEEVCEMFEREYLGIEQPIKYIGHGENAGKGNEPKGIWLEIEVAGKRMTLVGEGNGPIDGAIHALQLPIDVQSYQEQSMGRGSAAQAMAFIEMSVSGVLGAQYGVGVHENTTTAALCALIGGVNRAIEAGTLALPVDYNPSSAVLPGVAAAWTIPTSQNDWPPM